MIPILKLVEAFFDEKTVNDAVARARVIALRAGGALVRRLARAGIKRRRGTSKPGDQPFSHEGDLKKLLYFDYDRTSESEVIGPIKTGNKNVPNLLEFGGSTTQRFKHGGSRTINYRKHPYMAPALEQAAPQLPSHWRNSVRAA